MWGWHYFQVQHHERWPDPAKTAHRTSSAEGQAPLSVDYNNCSICNNCNNCINCPQDLKAAQRARHLLSLTEPQAKALALLFSSSSGLLPQSLTSEGRGRCSIVELSRLWALYVESAAWAGICEAWQAALQVSAQ